MLCTTFVYVCEVLSLYMLVPIFFFVHFICIYFVQVYLDHSVKSSGNCGNTRITWLQLTCKAVTTITHLDGYIVVLKNTFYFRVES